MSDISRDQALANLGRIGAAVLARTRGGTWLPRAGNEAPDALARQIHGFPHGQDMHALNGREITGVDHDSLDDAA